MPGPRYQRRRRERQQDVIKVRIEDVNLNANIGPMAQGRDLKDKGLFDIDLTHSVGGSFPTPTVGEDWWIKRGGRMWVLDRIISDTRTPPDGGGGGGSDDNRAGVPANVDIFFEVREKKKDLEYHAAVTFDAVTTDENGDAQETAQYVIDWVPCTKVGNIITDEKVRQFLWDPNDATIDDPLDPANDYLVILPGNVPRPKVWYWKARVRAVSDGGHKGAWSDWCEPSLPIRDSLPEPPYPTSVNLRFKWKDTNQQPIFSGVVAFNDVNYWDIPGFDYEDDVTEYEIQVEPLERDPSGSIDLTGPDDTGDNGAYTDGFKYSRADPNNDGEPWEIRRKKVKDKDADDTYVTLGTLAEDITEIDTDFDVDETGVVGVPAVPFIVLTGSGEKWLVTTRTLVAASLYSYEVYRQFGNTAAATHSTGAPLEWLKDPFRYKVDFDHIERPRTVYWRARVRSKDRFNRLGEWSPYTVPETPWSNIDFQVPRPQNLKADIQIRDYKTHPEFKLVARFEDPAPNGWNIPGGDLQDDLDHYVVVGEAVLPDPDGYIEAPPREWHSDVTYGVNEVVRYGGGRWRSLQSGNLANTPAQNTFWDQTTDNALFRIPDRRIGVLKNAVQQADTSMTVTLDADLPKSILRLLEDPDKQATYLRVLTVGAPSPQFPEEGGVSEVVATTDLTSSSGSDRTYAIERMQKGSQDWGHDAGDVVYVLTEHLRRHMVDDKDKDDPGKFNHWYTVNMGRIPQPKRFYWRVRARSVDTFGHKSLWTDWTDPLSPSTDQDLIIDAPAYVALSFDRVHRDRHVRFRTVVEFDEVHYNAPDGDREEDVSRYAIQLATTDGDNLELALQSGDNTMYVNERRKAPHAAPFYLLINDEYVHVTERTQGVGQVGTNLWTYTIERAARGTAAALHAEGELLFQFPHFHQSVPARHDKDPNSFNRVAFPRAQKWNYYKAQVRAIDRYNRTSDWTGWTAPGTPSDNDPPDPPTSVVLDVDEHKVHVTWDYPTDPRDEDTVEGRISGDDVEYFQLQLATAANFHPGSIIRADRHHLAHTKTWRMRKSAQIPGNSYYVRVRAVDASGNKSTWATDSGNQDGVPTPDAPVITFDTAENSAKLRADVTITGVSALDADNHDARINGYEFRLDPAENKRLTEATNDTQTTFHVNQNVTITLPYSIWIDNEKMTVTSKSGTDNLIWHVTRHTSGTTAARHRDKSRVYYFKDTTNEIKEHIHAELTADDWVSDFTYNTGDEVIYSGVQYQSLANGNSGNQPPNGLFWTVSTNSVLAIFKAIKNRRYYRARVRAKDTQGRWGNFSARSTVVRAVDLTPPDPPRSVAINVQQHHVIVDWETEPDPGDTTETSTSSNSPSFIQWTSGTGDLGVDSVDSGPFTDAPISGDNLYALMVSFDNAAVNVTPEHWVDSADLWDKVVDNIQDATEVALFQKRSDDSETGVLTFSVSPDSDAATALMGIVMELRDVPDPGFTTSSPNSGLTSPDVDVSVANQVVLHSWVVTGDATTGADAVTDADVILTPDNGIALFTGGITVGFGEADLLAVSTADLGSGVFGWLFILPVYYETTGTKTGITLTI